MRGEPLDRPSRAPSVQASQDASLPLACRAEAACRLHGQSGPTTLPKKRAFVMARMRSLRASSQAQAATYAAVAPRPHSRLFRMAHSHMRGGGTGETIYAVLSFLGGAQPVRAWPLLRFPDLIRKERKRGRWT